MRSFPFLVIIGLLFSCSQSGSDSGQSSDEPSPYGAFARGDADTLWVRSYESMMDPQIDFQLYAENEQVSYNLADVASLVESTEAKDVYAFSDSSEYVYSDLELIFSYENGNWTINDLAAKKDDSLKMDLSGEWKKVND